MRYAVIIEKGKRYYEAYVPDLPECGLVGTSVEEVKTLVQASITNHLQGLKNEGDTIPQPKSMCDYVEVG